MTPEEKKLEKAAKRKAISSKKKLQSTVPAETVDIRTDKHFFSDENEEDTYYSRFITEEFTINVSYVHIIIFFNFMHNILICSCYFKSEYSLLNVLRRDYWPFN